MNKIKLRVYSTSGPSWQPIKNGKPYNKWVGTIQYSDIERVMFGKKYTETVVGNSKEDVEKKLDKCIIGEVIALNPSRLDAQPIIGGNNATANR